MWRAAALYFLGVFALGFVLGALRVIWLAPEVGAYAAVWMELPLMLGFSWWLSGRLARGLTTAQRIGMGAVAFALLMMAEMALAVFAFNLTVTAWLAGLLTPEGKIGLAGQVAFGLFPWLQRTRG